MILSVACFFCCCKKTEIPSYVFIPKIDVTTTSVQGSASSNISDAWVYKDGSLLGVYELPVEFPFLPGDESEIVVAPGIKLNGISATRAAYPFYTTDTLDLMAAAGASDTVFPRVTYTSFTVFDLIADFEQNTVFQNITITNSEVFEGNSSGMISISDTIETLALSNDLFVISSQTAACFLEMDYKTNHLFEAGLRVITSSGNFFVYKLTIPPRNEWNKIYVNLTPEIVQLRADSYQIYFRVVPQTQADDIKIYFDNIKLMHARVL